MPAVAPFKEYNARVDARKRVVLRGAKHDYFRVLPRRDGTFVLKPCVMVDAPIAPEAIRCIGKSIASMKAGKRSKPEDLKKLAALKI